MPGNLILVGGDPATLYTAGLANRERGYNAGAPQLRGQGLLRDTKTPQKVYSVPAATISVGRVVRFKDGDRPGAKVIQGYTLSGTCQKRAIEGVRISEDDRLAASGANLDMDRVMDNLKSHGTAERLLEDKEGAAAIEAGETAAQTSFDGKPYFSTTHLIDPTGPNVAANQQSNRLALALTADNIFAGLVAMLKWKAENKVDPIYQGFAPKFKLMVPSDLAGLALKALRDMVAEGGTAMENVATYYLTQGDLFVNQYLTDATAWYLGVVNAGVELVTRVVHRERQRWDRGPDSALYEETRQIEFLSDEYTDYRLTDHRAWLKSKP